MGDLGQLLREAREQKGVSLEEVEETTHIRQKFLQALEEGNFRALPAETYVKGFLRTYATYLELDPEEVVALYEGQEDKGKTALPQPGFFQPMDISMAAPSWLTPDLVIGALLIVVLLVFGCWATWHYLPTAIKTQTLFWQATATFTPSPTTSAIPPSATPTTAPTTTSTVTPTGVPTSVPTATPTAIPTSVPTELPTATPTPLPTVEAVVEPVSTSTSTSTSVPTATPTSIPTNTPTPSISTGIEVELNIVEYAWLRILVDGEEVFVGSLEAGTTQIWQGQESVTLRCGNAGGVEAIVNGESLGLLGERGQVVDMEWFAEGIAPAPATPTPTATP